MLVLSGCTIPACTGESDFSRVISAGMAFAYDLRTVRGDKILSKLALRMLSVGDPFTDPSKTNQVIIDSFQFVSN